MWLRGSALMVLGTWLILAGACSSASQKEAALSALHFFDRGNTAFQAEDYHRAIEDYRKAVAYDDQAPDAYYNLGLAYYRVGAYQDAVESYQHAVTLDPGFADAHLNMALAYDKLYNSAAANMHYNRYRTLMTGKKEDWHSPAEAVPLPVSAGAAASSFQPVSSLAGVGEAAAKQQQFQPVGPGAGALQSAGSPAGAGDAVRRRLPQPATSVQIPQGARPGTLPPVQSLQQAEQPPPPNPFKGNAKWWTQDTLNPSQ